MIAYHLVDFSSIKLHNYYVKMVEIVTVYQLLPQLPVAGSSHQLKLIKLENTAPAMLSLLLIVIILLTLVNILLFGYSFRFVNIRQVHREW